MNFGTLGLLELVLLALFFFFFLAALFFGGGGTLDFGGLEGLLGFLVAL